MKKYIRSDESDYIRIGNRTIPKDASSYGDVSYDQLSQRGAANYQAELDAKAAEEKRQADIARGNHNYNLAFGDLDESASVDDQLTHIFEALVPPQGKCDNLGGELVRAMMRLLYRDYNDGDVFYEGYGLETCAESAAFIIDMVNDDTFDIDQMFWNTEMDQLKDDRYTAALHDIAENLIIYLKNRPEVFGQDTPDSRDYDSRTLREIIDNAPTYEYEPDCSGEILDRLIDNGHISWDEVADFLENLASYYGGRVHQWALDAFTIEDLDSDQYAEWERMFYKEWASWLNELEREYPEEDDYYEDEDEDEEDEF